MHFLSLSFTPVSAQFLCCTHRFLSLPIIRLRSVFAYVTLVCNYLILFTPWSSLAICHVIICPFLVGFLLSSGGGDISDLLVSLLPLPPSELGRRGATSSAFCYSIYRSRKTFDIGLFVSCVGLLDIYFGKFLPDLLYISLVISRCLAPTRFSFKRHWFYKFILM